MDTTEPTPVERPRRDRVMLWILVLSPLLYALSVGPVYGVKCGRVGLGANNMAERFYYPVFWFARKAHFENQLLAYVNQCVHLVGKRTTFD